jgi:hypothetical protein
MYISIQNNLSLKSFNGKERNYVNEYPVKITDGGQKVKMTAIQLKFNQDQDHYAF